MAKIKTKRPKAKSELHPRNRHRDRYDLDLLSGGYPPLKPFVRPNNFNVDSIDFANPKAVKALNTAILMHFYDAGKWDIPDGYLCPPVPGRADYIHHIADLLAKNNDGKIPAGKKIRCLDIGVGANCIYPIIGNKEYGWSFVGADIDPVSVEAAHKILEANPKLREQVEIRLQPDPNDILKGIINEKEYFDLTICNPPFHSSPAEAEAAAIRKLSNLTKEKVIDPILNFGGKHGELWCMGGEEKFVGDMIRQSKQFATSCYWFSSLISKQDNLKNTYRSLEKAGATAVETIPMGQGNKISRIVAWTFLNDDQRAAWKALRWGR